MKKKDKSKDLTKPMTKKKKITLLILLLIVLLGIGIVVMHHFGLFHYPWEKPVTSLYSGKEGMLPNISDEDALKMLQEQADKDQVRIQMNAQPKQQEDGTYDLMFQNLETNLYAEEVIIYLGEDAYGDLLFESGRILPGHYLDFVELQTSLEPGEHEAIAYVTFYDGDTRLATNRIKMKFLVE